MLPPFPPQFFILLGIDILLGGSIVIITFDEHFPTGLPYVLDLAALVGFIQLVLTPQYLADIPTEMQFYYCAAYLVVAALAVLGSNVYLVYARRERTFGGVFAIAATVPSVLAILFFLAAYVNGVSVSLPTIPLFPWPIVWGAFAGATAMIAAALVAANHRRWGRL